MELHKPGESVKVIKEKMGREGIAAFLTALSLGLITHMVALTNDIPNHDGLNSMYFDQNMITSGRFFLGFACGISSYYLIPWLIGVLSILYIAVASVLIVKVLDIKTPLFGGLTGAFLVTFPVLASNFAYVFTMDGYMLGLVLSVLSVLLTKKYKSGFLPGALSLALSMGIYQSYLPFAIMLSLYTVIVLFLRDGLSVKEKILNALHYVYMGVLGSAFYYIILNILLKIEGKVLDTYQGIDSLSGNNHIDIVSTVKHVYIDFIAFSLKGRTLFNNAVSGIAIVLFFIAFLVSIFILFKKRGMGRSVSFAAALIAFLVLIPIASNAVLFIAPDVTYHLLMRYQWVLFPIFMLSVIDMAYVSTGEKKNSLLWAGLIFSGILIFNYAVTDNIAYSNLTKKYEKTYAYCVRLLDRMENTEGYYPGIPVYMIGVVGEKNFPLTDITGDVTGNMIGIPGDYLLYAPDNYSEFFKYYLGVELNMVDREENNLYYEDWYQAMPSFPANGSVLVKDGILVIKTENKAE